MEKLCRVGQFFVLLLSFIFNSLGPLPLAEAQEFRLPAPGGMVSLSPAYNPAILKGIKVNPNNPFQFNFILDKGNRYNRHPEQRSSCRTFAGCSEGSQQEQLKTEATRLIKYFLASLTIPENDLWVNLSPYEKNRIIPQSFGLTEMGRDLLAEDYMLKQITASLIYPEGEVGKRFWKRIYAEAAQRFGTTNIPVNTFNKVWIVPEKAVVYENAKAGTAYVVEAKLKVMLEQDYLALQKNSLIQKKSVILSEGPHAGHSQVAPKDLNKINSIRDSSATPQNDVSTLGSQIVREIIIPELTQEVNEGKNFSQLRQVYNSLILATWYKKKIKDSILELIYADKNRTTGVEYHKSVMIRNPGINSIRDSSPSAQNDTEIIYQQYLKAFKKGVFNYIKEDQDPLTQQPIPRKYFSGGVKLGLSGDGAMKVIDDVPFGQEPRDLYEVGGHFNSLGGPISALDHAMRSTQVAVSVPFVNLEEDSRFCVAALKIGVDVHLYYDDRMGSDSEINLKNLLKKVTSDISQEGSIQKPPVLDVQLDLTNPSYKKLKPFADAGASRISVTIGRKSNITKIVNALLKIKSELASDSPTFKIGLALPPDMPVSILAEHISDLDFVLLGPRAQGAEINQFETQVLEQLAELTKLSSEQKPSLDITIQGGIDHYYANQLANQVVTHASAAAITKGSTTFVLDTDTFISRVNLLRAVESLKNSVQNLKVPLHSNEQLKMIYAAVIQEINQRILAANPFTEPRLIKNLRRLDAINQDRLRRLKRLPRYYFPFMEDEIRPAEQLIFKGNLLGQIAEMDDFIIPKNYIIQKDGQKRTVGYVVFPESIQWQALRVERTPTEPFKGYRYQFVTENNIVFNPREISAYIIDPEVIGLSDAEVENIINGTSPRLSVVEGEPSNKLVELNNITSELKRIGVPVMTVEQAILESQILFSVRREIDKKSLLWTDDIELDDIHVFRDPIPSLIKWQALKEGTIVSSKDFLYGHVTESEDGRGKFVTFYTDENARGDKNSLTRSLRTVKIEYRPPGQSGTPGMIDISDIWPTNSEVIPGSLDKYDFLEVLAGHHYRKIEARNGADLAMKAPKTASAVNEVGVIEENNKLVDKAAIAQGKHLGGIDLTPARMNLETKMDSEIRFHLDPAMLAQMQNVTGFEPVIDSIHPLKDLKSFLSL